MLGFWDARVTVCKGYGVVGFWPDSLKLCLSLSESRLRRAIVLERIWVCWAWVPGVISFLPYLVFWVDCCFGESFFILFACLGFGLGPLICV